MVRRLARRAYTEYEDKLDNIHDKVAELENQLRSEQVQRQQLLSLLMSAQKSR